MHILTLFFMALTIFGLGAVVSLVLFRRTRMAHMAASAAAIAGSGSALVVGCYALARHSVIDASAATTLPLLRLSLHIDPLASLFMVIVAGVALLTSIYGIAYMRQYYGEYNLGIFGFFYNLFIASLLLVITAHNGLYFIFVWELMSLSSLFLVLFEYRKAATIAAGLLYFLMTHIATAFLLMAFLLLYHATGSFDFGIIHSASGALSPWLRGIVAVCFLIGFGTKAGIIPVHIWLPKAHSAA
ncbi:MAG: proton-conducting transporter membrane subunit, partial [Candidatus Micrarchaeaceae archaeon]